MKTKTFKVFTFRDLFLSFSKNENYVLTFLEISIKVYFNEIFLEILHSNFSSYDQK